jgi:NTE family protein
MTGTDRDTTTATRGLVLGGGGVAGIAWETGLLSGLIAAGVDLGAADTVVGTSAGSVVAINLRAGAIDAAYDEHFVDVAGMAEPTGSRDLSRTIEVIGEGVVSTAGEIPTRQRIGEFALEEYDPEVDDAASVERIGQLLPIRDWPEQDLRITAVDAGTGRFTVFDKDSGADLVRASAASCAVPGVFPPVTIDGHPYMDGGMRSGTNADVVADHERILVIACGPEAPQSGMGPTLSGVVRGADQAAGTASASPTCAACSGYSSGSWSVSHGLKAHGVRATAEVSCSGSAHSYSPTSSGRGSTGVAATARNTGQISFSTMPAASVAR